MNGRGKPNPPKIFVYGTLKPGGRNYFLARGVTHAEDAYLDGYTLLHFEPEGYPAMVPSGISAEGRVYGVVLTFADLGAVLPELDALEGLHLNPPEYRRVLVNVQPSNETVWTYVYINQTRLEGEGVTPVMNGNWPHLG